MLNDTGNKKLRLGECSSVIERENTENKMLRSYFWDDDDLGPCDRMKADVCGGEASDDTNDSDVGYFEGESSDDGFGAEGEKLKFPTFNENSEMNNYDFTVGMLSKTKKDLKAAIIQHVIDNRRKIHFLENNAVRVRAKCAHEHCP